MKAFTILFVLTLFVFSVSADEVKIVKPEEVGLSTPRLQIISNMMHDNIDEKKMAGVVVLVARFRSRSHPSCSTKSAPRSRRSKSSSALTC